MTSKLFSVVIGVAYLAAAVVENNPLSAIEPVTFGAILVWLLAFRQPAIEKAHREERDKLTREFMEFIAKHADSDRVLLSAAFAKQVDK